VSVEKILIAENFLILNLLFFARSKANAPTRRICK
jgi:hypothetical protein